MGFWQALDAGLTARIEEQTRQKERQQEIDLRTAERDELRAYQEKQDNKNRIFQTSQAMLPLIVKQRQEREALATQRAQLGGFFENRLTDLPEETRSAFSNLALQAPSYSEALIGEVKKVETEIGRQITGSEILKMTSLIETTKPKDMSLEEWTKQAASMTVTSGSSIDFDETLANLLSGDLGLPELQEMQVDLMMPLGGDLNIIPDFDTSAVVGADPQVAIQFRNLAVSTMQDRLKVEMDDIQRQVDATTTGEVTLPAQDLEALKTKFQELQAIDMITETAEREALLFDYYAPKVLPQLAATYPRIRSVFPQYFQSTPQAEVQPTITYDFVNGRLVEVTQ